MIKSIRCDQESFKAVKFEKGFNVVLAEKSKGDTRNGVGKTALIEIIHFCLGGPTKPDQGLGVKELRDWTFILDLTLNGSDYTLSRKTTDADKVIIEGDFLDWPIKPEYDRLNKEYFMKTKDWSKLLGYLMFGLPIAKRGKKYAPSFRSVISYFSRHAVDAFQYPFKHYTQQKEWDIQVNNAYLLGLNWEYAAELQTIRDKKKTLNELKKAASQGLLPGLPGSLRELELKRVGLKVHVDNLHEQLNTFKVHPQYYEIQTEADSLTRQIHKFNNKYFLNKAFLNKYKESLKEEVDISVNKVNQIYKEVGLVFSKNQIRQLDDVIIFHTKVIRNRNEYLQLEIKKISKENQELQAQVEDKTNRRADLLHILKSHGALEEYLHLVDKFSSLKHQLEETNMKIEQLK